MVTRSHLVIGLGELLWDLLPGGRRSLGGSPGNVAYHAEALGDRAMVLTRVGRDALGDEAVSRLQQRGVDISGVQRDSIHPTGVAHIQLGAGGDVHFTIETRAAWVHPTWTEDWARYIAAADAVCFGTLLCAWDAGRAVVERAAGAASARALRLLDLNLRPPLDTGEAIDAALACANAIKLSEDEALLLAARLGVGGVDPVAEHLLSARGMRAVAVTYGARGSALYTGRGCERLPGVTVAPDPGADPVGAGDAFAAALVHHLIRDHAPARALAAANRYGAFVAARAGAMPEVPEDICHAVTAQTITNV